MADSITLGVIGAGGIFRRRHFPAIADIDDVSVAMVANRSEDSARSIIDEFDLAAEASDEPQSVIDAPDIDAVMIGTYPYKHHPYGLAALKAGKHTFVQARMAASLREAKALYAASREADLVTQICPSPMAMRADAYVQSLVDDGFLGDIYHIRGTHLGGDGVDPDRPRHWRDVERYQGVNALAVGILIEVIHRWFGHTESVAARSATPIPDRPLPDDSGRAPVERPQTVTANCRFENGATGTFEFSSVTRAAPENRIEAYGSEGTLVYDLEADTLYGAEGDAEELSVMEIPSDVVGEWTVESDFIRAIRTGGSPRATFREGVKYMEFTEAVCRSIESGSAVSLPLVT